MGDAAHAGPQSHQVFSTPLKVEPQIETWDTPGNYRRYPGGDELPGKMDVWRVQNTDSRTGGVVARAWGFEDSPDAEVIVAGYNDGREYGAVGIGRHGSFLQWGYSAPPSKMTEAGWRLFVNCVHYIRRFEGKGPLIQPRGSDRIDPIRLALLIGRIKDESFFEHVFPAETFADYKKKPKELAQLYRDDYEFIYRDQVYRIDTELKSLGIESNRRLGTLDSLIDLLEKGDDEQAEVARRLLLRYTTETFRRPAQWRRWLEKSRDRIYFSDVGGFKFRVVPEGYLD